NFVNGQLYALTPWVREMIYYTYGEIEKKHNAFGGTNGSFGYPIQHPKVVDGAVHQEFDSHQTLWWNTQDSSVAIYDSEALQCQLYEGGSSSIIGNARAGARGLADALTRVGEGIRGLSYLYVDIVTQEDDTVAALQEAVWNINLERLVNAIGAAFVGDAQEAYTDYTAARNDPNGCSYRTWYVGGIALGVAVDYLFPSKKLQTATKLKLAERLPGLLKYIDNISPGRLKSVGRIGNNGFVHRLTRQADIDEWNRIKAITDSNKKGSDGELFMHGMLGEGLEIQQPFPTSLGVRNADLFDPKPGKNLAHEVKFRQEISYSGSVKNQIEKEIELMNNLGPGNYQPIWHFLEAGPTEGLRKAMEDNGILYVIYTQ
ncbi:MAG: hypothetical protein U1C18_00575, partial [Patescibacteria group bacterium]|nr:hypothetical protein [Patescibacteria group bacterium]